MLKRITTLTQLEFIALLKDMTDEAFIRVGGSLFQWFTILSEKASPPSAYGKALDGDHGGCPKRDV